MSKALGVGIIGASAARGWAKDSHVPAVKGLQGLKLVAVAAGDEQKARAAAQAFGAPSGYASGIDLIQDPTVDIVTVAVKVPDHRELVLAAISAGKHVYCEWPLGKNLGESEEMAEAAKRAGIHTAIGLQMRSSAAVLQAREMLAQGTIGRLLTARILSNTAAFGPHVEPAMKFAEDDANGVTLVSIQGAHTFDLAIAILGEFASISALATTQYPEVKVGDTGKEQARRTSDHVFLQAKLASGVAVGIEVAGGRPPQAPTVFEVIGTGGSLTLRGGAMRGVQSGRLELQINGELQHLEEGEETTLPDAAVNVAGTYATLRNDIQNGTFDSTGFSHAVQLKHLVEAVLSSSRQGKRQVNDGWPVN